MSNICEILTRQAEQRPRAPAITQRRCGRDVTLTYRDLEAAVRAEADRLRRRGLVPGDRVVMLCPVSLELYVAVLGLLWSGVTAVFVDPGVGWRRLDTCCTAAKPKAVIAASRAWLLRPFVRSLRWGLKWLSLPGLCTVVDTEASGAPLPVIPDHPATLSFTSGSTAEPRGVLRTHGFLEQQQRALAHHFELAAGQTDLSTMPMFVLGNLAAGVHSVLADGNFARPAAMNPARLVRQVRRHNIDRTLASPALLERLADHCLSHAERLETMRQVDTGGAPVFPRTLRKLRRAMPAARLRVVYGSTEVEPIATRDVTQEDEAERTRIARGDGLPAGNVADDVQVCLMSPGRHAAHGSAMHLTKVAFRECCLGPGEAGEILVSGERVNAGYLDSVGDEQTKLRIDGRIWHRTGDLGRLETDGRLWLLGRMSARVCDGRGVLEPLAVEAAAMEHAAVVRCALVPLNGERVLVVERSTEARRAWQNQLIERLAWAQIDRVICMRRLPMDRRHNAKLDYPALRERLGAEGSPSTTRTVPAAPFISTQSPS